MGQQKRTAKAKGWSYKAGERGKNRVRLYERRGHGIWIDYLDESGKRRREPLGIADRAEAKARADELAVKFRRAPKRQTVELTLAALIDIYEKEVSPTKGKVSRAHDKRAMDMFLREFGRDTKPSSLSRREWDRYVARRSHRKAGAEGSQAGPVRKAASRSAGLTFAAGYSELGNAGKRRARFCIARPQSTSRTTTTEGRKPKASHPVRRSVRGPPGGSSEAIAPSGSTGYGGSRDRSPYRIRSPASMVGCTTLIQAVCDGALRMTRSGWSTRTLLTARAVTALKEAQTRTLSIGDAWMFPAVRGPAGCLTSHAANHISSAPRPNHRVTRRTERFQVGADFWRRFATSVRGGDPKTIPGPWRVEKLDDGSDLLPSSRRRQSASFAV